MANNLFEQAPFALRGENDARIAALETRLRAAETELATAKAELANITDGAWATWNPTVGGLTQGNGVLTARYARSGRTIDWYFKFVFGSTSAITGLVTFTLPVPPLHTTDPIDNPASVQYKDDGTAQVPGWVHYLGGAMYFKYMAAAPNMSNISATTPFTWAINDVIVAQGTYEAAS